MCEYENLVQNLNNKCANVRHHLSLKEVPCKLSIYERYKIKSSLPVPPQELNS